MKIEIITSTLLFFMVLLGGCSLDSSPPPSCSFSYAGTLRDGGTVRMTVNVACFEEAAVAKLEKNVGTVKRVLSMALLQQKTEDLEDRGQSRVCSSLYKIIRKYAHVEIDKVTVSEFELTGRG